MRQLLGYLFALAAWASMAAVPIEVGAASQPRYELEISKARRTLVVKRGDRVERTYRVSTGRGGHGDKQRSGDNKTPIGTYRIVRFNDNSRFYFFMQLNYPNVKDAFYGLKHRVISRSAFDDIIDALRNGRVPPQNTRLGGLIGIHGIGDVNTEKLQIHEALDWTEGCIALTNDDVRELRRYVDVGTVVVISE